MTFETVIVERRTGYALLTLNRPGVLNAISPQLAIDVVAAMAQLDADPDVGAVLVTGAGRGFCSGLDTRVLGASGTRGSTCTRPRITFRPPSPLSRARWSRRSTASPILADLRSLLACDVIVAAESAKFVDGHSRIGLLPGWGLASRLQRLIGEQRARYLQYTGRPLSGRMAEQWGLASLCVPDAELIAVAAALVAR